MNDRRLCYAASIMVLAFLVSGGCGGGGTPAAPTPTTIRGQVLQPPAAALSRSINRQGVNGLVAPPIGTVVTWSTFNITNVNGTFTPTAGTTIAQGQTTDNQGNYTVTSNAGTQPNANQCVTVGSGSNMMANCVTGTSGISIRPATQAGFQSCVNFAGQNNINLNTTAPAVLTSVQNYISVFVANAPATEGSGSVSAGVTAVNAAVNVGAASQLQSAQSGLQTTSGGGTALSIAFFPLNPGDVHEYKRTNPDNSTQNQRHETGSPTTPNGFSSQVTPSNDFNVVGSTKTLFHVDFFTADSVNGVQHFGEQESSCVHKDTPPQQIPNGLTVGQSTTTQNIVESIVSGTCVGGNMTFKATFEAVETVITPAGTFSNCIRLRFDQTSNFGNETNTVWVAQGIGIVKQIIVNSDGTNTELLTFARVGNMTVGTEGSFGGGATSRVLSSQSRPQLGRSRSRGW